MYNIVYQHLIGFMIGIVGGGILGYYYGIRMGEFPVFHIAILAAAVTGLFVIPLTESAFLVGGLSGVAMVALVTYLYTLSRDKEFDSGFLWMIILGPVFSIVPLWLSGLFWHMGGDVVAAYIGIFIGLLFGLIVGGVRDEQPVTLNRFIVAKIVAVVIAILWVLFLMGRIPGDEMDAFCLLLAPTVLIILLFINMGRGAVTLRDETDDSPDRFGESF